MKVLFTTFLFLGLLFSSDVKENKTTMNCVECEAGTGDYCAGWADGREQSGESIDVWRGRYNSCVKKRGCPNLVLPISQ